MLASKKKGEIEANGKVLERMASEGSKIAKTVIDISNQMSLTSISKLQKRVNCYNAKSFQDLRNTVAKTKQNSFFSMNLAQIADLGRSPSPEKRYKSGAITMASMYDRTGGKIVSGEF